MKDEIFTFLQPHPSPTEVFSKKKNNVSMKPNIKHHRYQIYVKIHIYIYIIIKPMFGFVQCFNGRNISAQDEKHNVRSM